MSRGTTDYRLQIAVGGRVRTIRVRAACGTWRADELTLLDSDGRWICRVPAACLLTIDPEIEPDHDDDLDHA